MTPGGATVASVLDVAVVALVVAVLAVVVWGALRTRRSDYGRLVARRSVLVNLTTGTAVEGVVWEQCPGYLVLRAAKLHETKGPVPVDGEVLIECSKVEFVQLLPRAAD